jgi:hypothetical protein
MSHRLKTSEKDTNFVPDPMYKQNLNVQRGSILPPTSDNNSCHQKILTQKQEQKIKAERANTKEASHKQEEGARRGGRERKGKALHHAVSAVVTSRTTSQDLH